MIAAPEGGPLDDFIPVWDVRERHAVMVRAPARLVFQVATEFDLQSLVLVRTIFSLRDRLLGTTAAEPKRQGFLDEMRELGWGCLIERPGTLYVAGAVCQPWMADVVFAPVAPHRFKDFDEPDLVKIAWTLESYDRGGNRSELVSETRVTATDDESRRRFLRYWRWARFGIISIRWLLLPGIRKKAETMYRGKDTR